MRIPFSKRATLVAVILAVAAADASWAQDYGRPGPYAAFLGLGAIETFDDGPFNFSDGGGFNLRGGYRIIPNLAAEMQFEYVEGFSDRGIDLDSWNLMWSAKGFLLTDRWQPYGLFGIGVIQWNANRGLGEEEDFAVRLGGGLDFYATKSWVLTGEVAWVKPTDDLKDLSYVTIGAGVQYRF